VSEINLRLKTYDELTFEISRLNTDKYLLEQKLQQKETIIKEVRGYIESYMPNYDFDKTNLIKILEILDKGSDKE